MRYNHCVDPGLDNFSFNKLMFTNLNDMEGMGVIVSVAIFDVVVVVIADFTVFYRLACDRWLKMKKTHLHHRG
jgi:hypothetical protein